MSQERMHPDDLRAIMAAQLALSSDDLTTGDVARGIEGADAILAELARTAKPENEEPHPDCKGCGMGCETAIPETCEMLRCTAHTEESEEETPRPFQIGDRVRRINYPNSSRVPVGSIGTLRDANRWVCVVEWEHDPTLIGPGCNSSPENLQLIPNKPKEESHADHRVRLEMERADKAEAELSQLRPMLAEITEQNDRLEEKNRLLNASRDDFKRATEKAELLLSESVRQLVEAEARVKELDNSLAIAESWRNDAALGLGEKRNKRIAELEQWQWDNMKKWLGIIGWGSMTPTQPECPTLIDAALQQGVEDAKRVDTLEARVKELEDAIRFHQSSLVAGHEVDRQLWSKVK